jgi:hypothetical protein
MKTTTTTIQIDRVPGDCGAPAIRTNAVYVVFTNVEETMAALRTASAFAWPMGIPVTLVHVRPIPYALPVDMPSGISPIETDGFGRQLEREGLDVQARVYLCRDERRGFETAFERHSLIMLGGRRGWWSRRVDRLRRTLEAAGHLVMVVDPADQAGGRRRPASVWPVRSMRNTEKVNA